MFWDLALKDFMYVLYCVLYVLYLCMYISCILVFILCIVNYFFIYEKFNHIWIISTVTTKKQIHMTFFHSSSESFNSLSELKLSLNKIRNRYWMKFSSILLVFLYIPFFNIFLSILVAFSVLDFHHQASCSGFFVIFRAICK